MIDEGAVQLLGEIAQVGMESAADIVLESKPGRCKRGCLIWLAIVIPVAGVLFLLH